MPIALKAIACFCFLGFTDPIIKLKLRYKIICEYSF